MADSGSATTFEALATKSIYIGNNAFLISPYSNAKEVVITGGAVGGINILSTTAGYVAFGDAGQADMGSLYYDHLNNSLAFTASGSVGVRITADRSIDMREAVNKTPTIILSGAIFISGGALWYKGFTGTYTLLAAT